MIFKDDIFSTFYYSIKAYLILIFYNLIEKKMTRRASFNFAGSYIVRLLTFSDLKCYISETKETILSREAKWSFIYLQILTGQSWRLDLQNQVRHAFSKLSFLIEFALCQKSSEYLGCLVNRKSGASLPHWLTSKWCKSPGPHWGLLRPPKRCKKMQRKSVLLIFLLNLWNITLIIDVFRHLNANCRRF